MALIYSLPPSLTLAFLRLSFVLGDTCTFHSRLFITPPNPPSRLFIAHVSTRHLPRWLWVFPAMSSVERCLFRRRMEPVRSQLPVNGGHRSAMQLTN